MKKNHLYLIIFVISFYFVFPFLVKAANPALQFDGSDNYVLLPTMEIGSAFTIECWFYSAETFSYYYAGLLKDEYTASNFGTFFMNYDTGINTNVLEWWFGGEKILYTSGLDDSTWYHLVFTADGTTVTLYINGQKRASQTASPYYNNTLGIGQAQTDMGNQFFNGRVDEVRLYNRALSATEVTQHYQWTFSNESGLVGLWHFDEGSGEVAADSSGQGNNAVIYGASWIDASEIVPSAAATPPAENIVTNLNPKVAFTKIPEERTWQGKKEITYSAMDSDPQPRGLISKPINFYYSNDDGGTWHDLAKEELNTGSFTFDSSKLPDGSNYKIKLTAIDGWGAVGQAVSNTFSIDNTGPNFTIAISSSAPLPIKEKDKITLDITSSEDLRKVPEIQVTQQGADPQILIVSGSGKKFSAVYIITRGYAGTAVISAKGEDLMGNIGTKITAGATFPVGRLGPPPPTIESPLDNQIFTQQKINVSGKASLTTEVTLVLNGTDKFTQKPAEDGSFVFKDIVLSKNNNGYNTLTFSGLGKDGVQSADQILKIKLNQLPQIALISKLEGTISGQKKIEWSSSDLNNDKLSYVIDYSIDEGKNWDNLVSGLIENYYDFNTVELFDSDRFRLKIIADDGAGKSAAISGTFSIKNNQSLSISNIPENYLVKTTKPSFEGEARLSQNNIVSLKYSLDKEEWLSAEAVDGKFNSLAERFEIKITSSLGDGKYTLSLQAKDDKENIIKTFRIFIIDTLPPAPPTVTSPGADEVMGKNKDIDPDTPGIQIDISGKAEAGADLELSIHEITYQTTANSRGEFTFSKITLLNRGLNRYSILSSDAGGNVSKIDGSIVSNNSPEVSIIFPQSGEFIGKKAEIKWQGSDKDGDELTFQIFYRLKSDKWISLAQVLSGDNFEWDTSKLANGEYELKIIANDGLSEGSATSKIYIDSKPPQVSFDIQGPVFTNNIKYIFSGKAKDDFSGVEYVEYSLDNVNWYKALITEGWQTNEASFEFYHRPRLPEGKYTVKVRATDGAGNVSSLQELGITVDTTPPVIGSSLISSGALIIFPDENGIISLFKNESYEILAAVSNDAKEVALSAGNTIFNLSFNKSIALWQGEFKIPEAGDYSLEITAKDEFGGTRTKKIADLKILSPGFVYNEKNNERIKGANVSLYVFDEAGNSWLIWDASSFEQKNPQPTNEAGEYDFIIPAGKYRLQVEAAGFDSVKSKDLEIKNNLPLNLNIPLSEKTGIFQGLLKFININY